MMKMRIALIFWIGTALIALQVDRVSAQVHDPRALEADPATATEQIAPVLDGLGDYHMKVTTS